MRNAIFSTLAVALALVAPSPSLAAPTGTSTSTQAYDDTPAYPSPTESAEPAPTNLPVDATCTKNSSALVEWPILDFDYHQSITFSTPAHQIAGASVSFTLVNPATGYNTTCRANSSRLGVFFLGEITYKCDTVASEDPPTFTFSWPATKLQINQSWSCAEEGTRFKANGGVELDLQCHTSKWQNPSWHQGDLYSTETTKCDKLNVTAPIDALSVVG